MPMQKHRVARGEALESEGSHPNSQLLYYTAASFAATGPLHGKAEPGQREVEDHEGVEHADAERRVAGGEALEREELVPRRSALYTRGTKSCYRHAKKVYTYILARII